MILEMLAGGDRRSIGRVPEVIELVERQPGRLRELIEGIEHNDPVVRMRAADAVEKLTRGRAAWLEDHREALLRAARAEQKEVRWHVAPMLSRLQWPLGDLVLVVEILKGYLEDKSSIVRTNAMEALADLAERDVRLLSDLVPMLEHLTATGSAAMRSRGRKLLGRFGPR